MTKTTSLRFSPFQKPAAAAAAGKVKDVVRAFCQKKWKNKGKKLKGKDPYECMQRQQKWREEKKLNENF